MGMSFGTTSRQGPLTIILHNIAKPLGGFVQKNAVRVSVQDTVATYSIFLDSIE